MEEAVTNSTVLIFLSKIRKLNLLNIYKVFTTQNIIKEVLEGKGISDIEKINIQEFITSKIKIENPKKIILQKGIGESSAISLCIEKEFNIFLSDDKQARKAAELFSLKSKGCLGLILENLEDKNITKEEAVEILNSLIKNNYYLTTEIYTKILELINKY